MTRHKILLAAMAAVVAFTGCAAGPHYRRPAVVTPQQWSGLGRGTSEGAPAADHWWTEFHDPQLDKLVQRAAEQNLDVRIALARIDEARALRGLAKSALVPSVSANASGARLRQNVLVPAGIGTTSNVTRVPIETNNFQRSFDAAWEVDVFGRIRRTAQAAGAEVQASQDDLHSVQLALASDVVRNYALVRGYQLRLNVAEKNIKAQQENLDLTVTRAQAGLATELDVARARAQLESTRAAVPSLTSAVETSIHRLSVLLGEQPASLQKELETAAPLPVAPPEIPAGMPSQLLERRPDIRSAEARVMAATARVGEAKADFFPKFYLTGSAGRQSTQLHDLTIGLGSVYSAGPAISLPIFTGGRIRSNIAAQDARLRQAAAAYQSAVLIALEETENALTNYVEEQERRDRLQAEVDQNRTAVELSGELYRAGLVDFLSVLDAERQLYASEDLLAQSQTTVTTNAVALYKALGGGWGAQAAIAMNEK